MGDPRKKTSQPLSFPPVLGGWSLRSEKDVPGGAHYRRTRLKTKISGSMPPDFVEDLRKSLGEESFRVLDESIGLRAAANRTRVFSDGKSNHSTGSPNFASTTVGRRKADNVFTEVWGASGKPQYEVKKKYEKEKYLVRESVEQQLPNVSGMDDWFYKYGKPTTQPVLMLSTFEPMRKVTDGARTRGVAMKRGKLLH